MALALGRRVRQFLKEMKNENDQFENVFHCFLSKMAIVK